MMYDGQSAAWADERYARLDELRRQYDYVRRRLEAEADTHRRSDLLRKAEDLLDAMERLDHQPTSS
jgi:type II secretory pathway component PulJ